MSTIELKDVRHVYSQNSPFEKVALDNINLSIDKGEFIGLIGHTGSGKSTLVQHLNGLLRPTSGSVVIGGKKIENTTKDLTDIRREVGLLFQYPEYQLFEETVERDIGFGPRNLKLSDDEVKKRIEDSMNAVGLDYEEFKDKSPFELSGGQKRRVAIAGVLAMKPEILILDEPTAGLDPAGRDEILNRVNEIYKRENMTIVLVSHSMEDVANFANRIIVMHSARILMDDVPVEIFKRDEELESIGLGVPQINKFLKLLKKRGANINSDLITMEGAKLEMLKFLKENANA